ncbi:MAG: hypothetical protein J6S67_01550 [Methanobrevibacter sp.]|nr:hypothetical protein [Methanobrevibacter sp.]
MAKRIAVTSLNASTIDILNTIRANASYEYQSLVPTISKATEIPKVGEVLYGYPALANQFLNALINRIALVRVKSAVFNNAYRELKKGYLEFGETVEEVFVNIAKAREFSAEKAESREFKRTLPDVRSAFHTMNWRVQYPITIQDQDLKLAFTSIDGVQDLIAKIVDAIYTAAEYDEYLLFKYLIIKAVSHGKMHPVAIGGTMSDAAIAFRGMSNKLGFMSTKYNESGVTTTTPKADQYIFMDSDYNAAYDVSVLAAAFNMDKAEFMGKLMLIDDFTTFDNDRFDVIRANSDMVESVTDAELALMAKVKAILIDKEWFQMYDNNNKFTEQYVASGMYWNYFYNVWKTVSYSPFSNAIVFVDNSASISAPDTITLNVVGVEKNDNSAIYTLLPADSASLADSNLEFIQDDDATEDGIAVHKYGAVIIPIIASPGTQVYWTPVARIGDVTYTATSSIYVDTDDTPSTGHDATAVGDTITLAKDA